MSDVMGEVLTDLVMKYGAIEDYGYRVRKWGSHGWILEFEDCTLMIGEHGQIAPRKRDAIFEAYRRIRMEAE